MFARSTPRCTHLDQINDVTPSAESCEERLRMGDTWVHLRECLGCGHVGCCDTSLSHRIRNALSFRAAPSPTGTVKALEAVRA